MAYELVNVAQNAVVDFSVTCSRDGKPHFNDNHHRGCLTPEAQAGQ